MPKLITLHPTKAYKTRANAIKAVERKLGDLELDHLRYIVYTTEDGRFFPVFIGQEAISEGVHHHFHCMM